MGDSLGLSFGFPFAAVFTASFGTFALDSATDAAEVVFQAEEAATISRLWYRHTAITGTAPTFQISLQGVDLATGNPDGVIKGAVNNAKATFQPVSGNNGVGVWINLGETYACSRGELLSVVIQHSSGTIDSANGATFTSHMASGSAVLLPYAIQNNAGTRARQDKRPIFAYGASGKAYGNPMSFNMAASFNDSSTPDEFALRFVIPADYGDTAKVAGIRFVGQFNPAASSATFTIYDGTTAVQSYTHDSDVSRIIASTGLAEVMFTGASLAVLSTGSEYRMAMKSNHASVNTLLQRVGVTSNADMAAWHMGAGWYQSSRADGGIWTDDTTIRPVMELILDDLTPPPGGHLMARLNAGSGW